MKEALHRYFEKFGDVSIMVKTETDTHIIVDLVSLKKLM